MRRSTGLLGTTALGLVLGAVLMNASPSLAQMATIDVAAIKQQIQSFAQETGILNVLNAMHTVQSTINETMSDIKGAIGPSTYGDTNTLLQQGFTQNANYSKAQVGAMGPTRRRVEHGKYARPADVSQRSAPGRSYPLAAGVHGAQLRTEHYDRGRAVVQG